MNARTQPIAGRLLDLFLKSGLPWMDVVAKQSRLAMWTCENLQSSYFVDFHYPEKTIVPIPVNSEVPIEILLGNVCLQPKETSGTICGSPVVLTETPKIFTVPDSYAFAIRLHFHDGILFELEAYSLNGNALDFSGMEEKKRVYLISDTELLKALVLDKAD